MSAQRQACAARLIYRDHHLATGRPWRLITPDGDELVLCSASCVLEVLCQPPLPAELERPREPAVRPRLAVVR
jgi:hypothetical protein